VDKEKTTTMQKVKEMTFDDWTAEGIKRFGEDLMNWRFVCCNCKHVQAVSDFRDLKAMGKFDGTPNAAYFSCIGRYDDSIPRNQIGTLGDTEGKTHCDYTLGGLIPINKLVVKMKDGTLLPAFEFAEATV